MNTKDQKTERLKSLDALRGFDMLLIIGGSTFFAQVCGLFDTPFTNWLSGQFHHVQWEGFVLHDLIMPLFLFMSGVSMPFSFSKRLSSGGSKKQILKQVIRRFIILYILGMICQGRLLHLDLDKLALFSNTLQAIAVGYLFSALMFIYLNLNKQVIVTSLLLVVYWLLMAFVPVAGFGSGVYTPEGNLAIHIDHMILGSFDDGTQYTWILSSLAFIPSVMFGVFAGQVLKTGKSQIKKFQTLLLIGVGMLVLAFLWATFFPIIKKLWTSSMALLAGGYSMLLMALFYYIIDIKKKQQWSFWLRVIGMNSIAVYVATQLFNFSHIGRIFVHGFSKWLGDWYPPLLTLSGFTIVYLILLHMYRRKIFVKV